ncbi:hypothetical protein ALC53_03363 [Atta colombica]|uniref:ZP domain-containing protein n=1 Tax=Atta colombica TaxID=520822 RepID=A0A195BPP1_9HYME|nr:hypothetical protein ALC53_03363 [Atta colombica]
MRHSDSSTHAAQIFQQPLTSTAAIASTVQIECASESIIVHISTEHNTDFHGLVYPRGLSKNSSCLQEYRSQPVPITYNLPLRSCNTMPTELRCREGRRRDNHHYYVASPIYRFSIRLSASRQFSSIALVTVITYDFCCRPDTDQNYSKGTKRSSFRDGSGGDICNLQRVVQVSFHFPCLF